MPFKIKEFFPILFLLFLMIWIIIVQTSINDISLISRIYELVIRVINENFIAATLIYSLIYFACVSFSIPVASYLTLLGGAIFNWLALPIIIISATSGAIVIFILSKNILSDFFSKKIDNKFENMRIGFRKNNFYYLLFLRLIPFAPFFVVNILAGIMNMRTLPYTFATIIGIIPGTAIYVWTGINLSELLVLTELSNYNLASSKYLLPIIILAILSLSPIFFKNIYQNYFNSQQ
tara:strand:+ start:2720 stop:3424 length:705 start_codon:yes stop_codon:yes gene_type:complete